MTQQMEHPAVMVDEAHREDRKVEEKKKKKKEEEEDEGRVFVVPSQTHNPIPLEDDRPIECLVHFAQIHETFRKAEIEALATMMGVVVRWVWYSDDSPYALILLPSRTSAIALVSRSILTKSIYEHWGTTSTLSALHTHIQQHTPHLWPRHATTTFKFTVESYLQTHSASSQLRLINTFSYLPLSGPINLHTPASTFTLLTTPTSHSFGLLLATGARSLPDKYDLKKRRYIGTTSMDAALSLITANMALIGPGSLAYDPFAGTGSFLVAAAAFGGTVWGSDIDGRQMRGRRGVGVKDNFLQYGLQGHLADCFVSDLTNTPVRRARWLDAVLCDPPYGVREGLKVLGSRDPEKGKEPVVVDGVMRHLQPDYVPPKRPYSFTAMLGDILDFAADHLVDGGRLCFWMPAANEDFVEGTDVPVHPKMEIVSVCVQEFNKWSRRLLTYSRRPDGNVPPATTVPTTITAAAAATAATEDTTTEEEKPKKTTADELNNFRKKYFEGFRPS